MSTITDDGYSYDFYDTARIVERPRIVFDLRHAARTNDVISQVYWWAGITVFVIAITMVPGVVMVIGHDRIEFAESLLISFGVQSIGDLTKRLIERIFSFINESGRSFYLRGVHFFMDENPLEQYMTERRHRYRARLEGVVDRRGQMASYPLVWLAIILFSFIVHIAPDVLGAGLISQTKPYRQIVPFGVNGTSDEEEAMFLAPNFGDASGDRSEDQFGDLTFRGNCVWSRGCNPSIKDKDSGFGFIIWQYCVDLIFNQSREDFDRYRNRTLQGPWEDGNMSAQFHVEVITGEIFFEDWDPFENITQSDGLYQTVLKKSNECPDAMCLKQYTSVNEKLTYRLLREVRLQWRHLRGDEKKLAVLKEATGNVRQRLSSPARAAFIVLVIAVKRFAFMQAVSHDQESANVRVTRAIGEL